MENILSHLPKIVGKRKKRLGRGLGSKKGAKSGRGTTRHQKARQSIPLHFEGGQSRMVKKFPLLRGKGRNKGLSVRPFILNVSSLNVFQDGEVVNRDSLVKKRLVNKEIKDIKILGGGKLEKKLTIAMPVSKGAKKAIEALGGKVEV